MLKIARERDAYQARREARRDGHRFGRPCHHRLSRLGDFRRSAVAVAVMRRIREDLDIGNHYQSMTLDQIAAFGARHVLPLAADCCVLFMWATWPLIALGSIADIIRAWGFEPKTAGFVWVKTVNSGDGLRWGNGYWTRSNSEPCLLATRGAPQRIALDVHQVVMAPVGAHSLSPTRFTRGSSGC
jgi:N6-adenosine-specific RNA methylase IME4